MKYIAYNAKNFRKIEYIRHMDPQFVEDTEIVSRVLPFKTNNYIVDYLIDWKNYETDPVYLLTFPNREMLRPEHFEKVRWAVRKSVPQEELIRIINGIRLELNPHPADQSSNLPSLNGEVLNGSQHKYRDIILFFPSEGQSCHAHFTFCFRWPQFVKDLDLQFSMREIDLLIEYIRQNDHIHEVLFTGGDPLIMSPGTISRYIDKLIGARLPNLKTIRFGTKSLTFWPFTFLPDFSDEAEDMLALFRKIVDNGYHLAFMAHFNHPNEMNNGIVQEAIGNIRSTGAVIRTQAPLLRTINDSWEVWSEMWKKQVNLGMIPYYMFVERQTGPYDYFSVPLKRVYNIYQRAIRHSASFAKTVTAPVMSARKGKVQILGTMENPSDGEQYFILQYVRHRDYSKTFKPFLMKYDETSTWVDQLEPVEEHSLAV
ncbi:MAG: lysine 2,3-aminomutase [Bacteroidales bacterium]|nr:lysine 2,3-aminomutase [Bacteroidales bacterium]